MRGNLFSARGLALLGLCGLCLIGCGLLAWWQWNRFESATGTLQNLGYVLQWPLFGLFPFYMFWRMRRLAASRDAANPAGTAESSAAESAPAPAARRRRAGPPPWQAPRPRTPLPDDEPDEELAAYNRYLAELNAEDADRAS